MVPFIRTVAISALVGAVAATACLALAFGRHPALVLDMGGDLPRITSGFYPAELAGEETFAWTTASAAVRLPGLDRDRPWECVIRARAGRGPGLPMPSIDVAVDGLSAASRALTNEYQDVAVPVPPRPGREGLVLTIAASATFVPGPGDRRQLGIQVDAISCAPLGGGIVLPPRRALLTAGLTGAAFGAAFGVTLPATLAASAAAVVTGAATAIPLSTGPAPYHVYLDRVTTLALWIAGLLAAVSVALQRLWREPLAPSARFVLAFSAATLFLHLLGLLHPFKSPVDVVFHAHRFQTVLAGNYFFTQPMPSGVRFPYAVALYVFTVPWSYFTQDYVTLLRVVVSACHVFAGALLYLVIARLWRDGLAGAIAVLLFHLVPLYYLMLGNANMTFAFGQSAAIVTIAAAASWRLASRDFAWAAALFVLAAVAFLSHVGIFPLLFTAMIAIGAFYWLFATGQLRAAAGWLVAIAFAAAIFSVVMYYGRFAEAYRTLDRVRGKEIAVVQAPEALPPPEAASAGDRPRVTRSVPRHRRLLRAFSLLKGDAGWPIVLLAVFGAWRLRHLPRSDRLKLVLWGIGLTYAAFVAFAVAVPVEPGFQRYADEFISRVDSATLPALVILAGAGAAWAWRAGTIWRAVVAGLLLGAFVPIMERWLRWFS